MLVFQQFLQYHGKGEGAIVIKIPRVKCSNSTNIYSQHPGLGAVKSQVIALTGRRKPQQPVVPQPEEPPGLIPKEGQQWGESVKNINFCVLWISTEPEESIPLQQQGEVGSEGRSRGTVTLCHSSS